MSLSDQNNPRKSASLKIRENQRFSKSAKIRVKKKSEYKRKVDRKLIIAANRRLQETSQKLFMAKQELEEKNEQLKAAQEKEKRQKEQLQRELNDLKRLAQPAGKAGAKPKKQAESIADKKLTANIAEDLSLRYIHLLESYGRSKDLDKDESLVEELCRKLIECGVTPKGIISMHLKSVSQVKTIGDLETKRVMFESRMVLLKVMTKYAEILRNIHR